MNGLPVEIIEGIFKHISSLEDITNCFNTCVQWRQIIERLFRENGELLFKFLFLFLLFDYFFKYSNYSQSNDCHK